MSLIIEPENNNRNILQVRTLNDVYYCKKDLELFIVIVCEKLQLNSLKKIIPQYDYCHTTTREIIQSVAQGSNSYGFINITESAKEFHAELFDVMYVKVLEDLPLLINGDRTIKPVVSWRFQIGK